MSSSEQLNLAKEAKDAGSNAWSSGNYTLAIEHFTKAISHIPSHKSSNESKELSKILFSNRSAALLKVKKIEEALEDAKKCIEIDSSWAKGYARKGDALYAKKLYTDAYNAYNAGLRSNPNDPTLTEKSEKAMAAIRDSASSSSSSSTGFSPSRNGGPKTLLRTITEYLKMGVLLASFLYLIPFNRTFSLTSYRVAVVSSLVGSIVTLFNGHGWPKFTSAFGAQLVADPASMTAFMALILLFSKPYLIALAALFIQETIYFLPGILTYFQSNLPLVQSSLQPILSRFLPSVRLDNVFALLHPSRIAQTKTVLLSMSAQCEVTQGCFLIVELILPSRNPMMLYLWWQYLQMRYLLDESGEIKRAFAVVDTSITGLLTHRYCPELVRKAYSLVKGFMVSQIASKQGQGASGGQGQSGGGISSLLSKCTVM